MNDPTFVNSNSADEYDYALPKELIAQHPLTNRADARLMWVNREKQSVTHWHIRDLPEMLNAGDCLVLNDTRVIPAKLVGYRTTTRGRWYGLFLDSDDGGHLKLLCKTRGKLKPGETITLQDREQRDDIKLTALARLGGGAWVFRPESDESPREIMTRVGNVPLPHYIRGGNMVDKDLQSYQTVFAVNEGAVAAPTAGLHFTDALLKTLKERGVGFARVTLHVGLGTFSPIKSEHIEDHEMHAEIGSVEQEAVDTLKETRANGGRVIAVGTTSMRVLETAARSGTLEPWEGETNLYIRPPFDFHAVDGLMTNFHFPRTTLLVLARTFGGDELIRRAYKEAIAERYRLFSYGDAMMIV